MKSGRFIGYLIAACRSLALIGVTFARDDNEGVVVRHPCITQV